MTARLASRSMLLALVALVGALLGCLPAIYNKVAVSTGQEVLQPLAAPQPGDTKADVLARFGPPVESIPQPGQDVFVYRFLTDGTTAVNGTPGYVPIYYSMTRRSERILFVYFDRDGVVLRTALTEGR